MANVNFLTLIQLVMKDKGNHEEPAQNEDQVKVKYQCPMKCEGEKVYDQPGKCPVCKMNLVKAEQ
jgi:hypothetical protein